MRYESSFGGGLFEVQLGTPGEVTHTLYAATYLLTE